jgi:DUF971 family protein
MKLLREGRSQPLLGSQPKVRFSTVGVPINWDSNISTKNMSIQQNQPKTLKRLGTGFLIEWKDGHFSEYPHRYLRQMCPCAECSFIRHDGHDVHSLFAPQGDGNSTLIAVPDDISPADIQLVGRYALQFIWSDGHSTGIYSFETLRELCPCPECTP